MVYTKENITAKLNNKQKLKRRFRIMLTPLMVIIVLSFVSVIFQMTMSKGHFIDFFGYKLFRVLSGSMEPTIQIGDVIVVKSVNTNKLQIGDVITYYFETSNHPVTHRISDIVYENGVKYFKTKGDNNNAEDTVLIPKENVLGVVTSISPEIGNILNYINTSGVISILLLVGIVYWYMGSRKRDKQFLREDARVRYNVCKYKKYREGKVNA